MSGKAILVVGARGTGKTTTNKTWAKKVHPDRLIIFDYQGEYKDIYPKPFIGFKSFAKMLTEVHGMFIVIEEATVFLSNRGYNGDIVDLLVSARHNDNTIMFSFHSFAAVPGYIYDLCNMAIVHKTGDNPDDIDKKFKNGDLLKAFNEIKAAPMLVNKDSGKEYSPHKIVKLY